MCKFSYASLLFIYLNIPWIKEEIKGKEYFKSNQNETATYYNLWDADKLLLRGKFIALNTYKRIS